MDESEQTGLLERLSSAQQNQVSNLVILQIDTYIAL
jgi:hypothetical protein